MEKFRRSAELCSNLCSEILLLLLDTFAGLETNESLYRKVCAVVLANLCKILCNGLLAVLCLNVNLLKQAYFLQLFVQTDVYKRQSL